MSGGVYGGGERASGFGLPSLAELHLKPSAPNRRDQRSGHPGACHLGARVGPAPGLGPAPLLPSVLPRTLAHPTQPLHPSTQHCPAPSLQAGRVACTRPLGKKGDSGSLIPIPRTLDFKPISHLPGPVSKVARLWLCPDLSSELTRGREFGRDLPHTPISPHR